MVNKTLLQQLTGFWKQAIELLQGQVVSLMTDDLLRPKLHVHTEIYTELQSVPLASIKGNIRRYEDFQDSFLPQQKRRIQKQVEKIKTKVAFPPIELYKIGSNYFVRDGSRRVALARQLKRTYIRAYVAEIPSLSQQEADEQPTDLDEATLYEHFLAETNLQKVPSYRKIDLSVPILYNALLSHITLQQQALSHKRKKSVSMTEAGKEWYTKTYLPLMRLIRKYKVLDNFTDRTEGDLYIWIVNHLHQIEREFEEFYGAKPKIQFFDNAFIEFLMANQLPTPSELHPDKQIDDSSSSD